MPVIFYIIILFLKKSRLIKAEPIIKLLSSNVNRCLSLSTLFRRFKTTADNEKQQLLSLCLNDLILELFTRMLDTMVYSMTFKQFNSFFNYFKKNAIN